MSTVIIFAFKVQKSLIKGSIYASGIVFQSFALPGFGLSRMTGNPHWLRGVAGYGCIAGSIVLNRMAITTYEYYRYTEPGTEKEDFFNKSVNQDKITDI